MVQWSEAEKSDAISAMKAINRRRITTNTDPTIKPIVDPKMLANFHWEPSADQIKMATHRTKNASTMKIPTLTSSMVFRPHLRNSALLLFSVVILSRCPLLSLGASDDLGNITCRKASVLAQAQLDRQSKFLRPRNRVNGTIGGL